MSMLAHAKAKRGHWASSSTSLQLICEPESLPELGVCSFSWLAREFRACLSPHSSVTGGHRWIGLDSSGPGGLKSEPLAFSARTLCSLSCLLRPSGLFPVYVNVCVHLTSAVCMRLVGRHLLEQGLLTGGYTTEDQEFPSLTNLELCTAPQVGVGLYELLPVYNGMSVGLALCG